MISRAMPFVPARLATFFSVPIIRRAAFHMKRLTSGLDSSFFTRLGIARRVPRERFNAAVAVREIRGLLEGARYAERAAELGSRVRAETGAVTASHLLTRLLERTTA